MSWTNYHCHCRYCDGAEPLEKMVEGALLMGLASVGISSHAPLPFQMPWSMSPERLRNYLAELESINKGSSIPVYKGLEVDFVPGLAGPSRYAGELDYTIGSIHFAGVFTDGRRLETDGSHMHFLEGVSEIYGGDVMETVKTYFSLTRQMLSDDPPVILGHLDKIKMQNRSGTEWNEEDIWYRSELEETITAAARAGVIIEVNTRGLYLGRVKEPYPGRYALTLIHEMNIPITLSSDAHHSRDLINGFAETALLLKQIGFQNLRILHEGNWSDVPFTPDGLRL